MVVIISLTDEILLIQINTCAPARIRSWLTYSLEARHQLQLPLGMKFLAISSKFPITAYLFSEGSRLHGPWLKIHYELPIHQIPMSPLI